MPRRKSDFGRKGEKPVQRNAANARERARMRVLSRAFCRLKTTLPWVPADTKLSKLDTLRLASSYISHLKGILKDGSVPLSNPQSNLHPSITLTWPFGFSRLEKCDGDGDVEEVEMRNDENESDCSWDGDEEEEEGNEDQNQSNRNRNSHSHLDNHIPSFHSHSHSHHQHNYQHIHT